MMKRICAWLVLSWRNEVIFAVQMHAVALDNRQGDQISLESFHARLQLSEYF